MREWKDVELHRITEPTKDSCNPLLLEEIPYIGLEHIEQGSLRLCGVGKSTDVTSGKLRFKTGDILFGKLRPYFRKVVHVKFSGLCSTDIWVFRAKPGFDQSFLFYFLATDQFIELANSGESGTRMPRADWSFLSKTVWAFPPLPEQRAIASVLSSLDDKIDLLQRQNETLEQMAEALFRQWFVEEAKEEWVVVSLYDSINLVGGGTPKTSIEEYWNGDIKWLTGADIAANHKSIITSTEKSITRAGLEFSSTKLLPKCATVIAARGTVGKFAMLAEPMAFSQSNYGITPLDGTSFYFTYLLINYVVDELNSAAYGSVFDTITTDTFRGVQVNGPSSQEIKSFDDKVRPFFQKMIDSKLQIDKLRLIRQTLLPKLMNGELTLAL